MREHVARIEVVKDAIVALFERTVSDASTRSIWIGDVKEAYYQLVIVDQVLSGGTLDAERASRVKGLLEGAKSRAKQVASELSALGDMHGAIALERDLMTELAALEATVFARISPLLTRPPPLAEPPARVIRRSESEYALPCSACGKMAMVVRVGPTPYAGKDRDQLIVEGVTGTTYLGTDHASPLLAALAAADLPRAHEAAASFIEGGLSGYCPECDRTYCRDELTLQEEFDDGFYDCTYGTCPKGHRRLIDD